MAPLDDLQSMFNFLIKFFVLIFVAFIGIETWALYLYFFPSFEPQACYTFSNIVSSLNYNLLKLFGFGFVCMFLFQFRG